MKIQSTEFVLDQKKPERKKCIADGCQEVLTPYEMQRYGCFCSDHGDEQEQIAHMAYASILGVSK